MTTWRKGPPPSIGWWPASMNRDPEVLRWWNGKWWSAPAYQVCAANTAAAVACFKGAHQDSIEWTDRPADWPERSKT
jgi:hypothetical protein